MWMLITLLSCQSKAENETAVDTGSDAGFTPSIPTTSCGEFDYNWLPTDQMGRLVDYEDVDELSLSKETINLLLEQLGVGGLAPVPYSVKTYRIRYVTQNQGAEIEATGLVTLPVEVESAAPPLLWTHPRQALPMNVLAHKVLKALTSPFMGGVGAVSLDYLGMAGWGEDYTLHPYIWLNPAVASLDL